VKDGENERNREKGTDRGRNREIEEKDRQRNREIKTEIVFLLRLGLFLSHN